MKPSIAVCTASGRDPKWPYTYGITCLMATIGLHVSKATYHVEMGYATDYARNKLVRAALDGDFSHLLFIDDDMSFPPNVPERLVAHAVDVVAANYTKRQLPALPVAQAKGRYLFSKGKTGLEEVDHAGTGMMMIRVELFKKLPWPWFKTSLREEATDPIVSDDVHFCRLAREHGYKIWVDHDLSQEIGHVGDMAYSHVHSPPEPIPTDLVELCREQVA